MSKQKTGQKKIEIVYRYIVKYARQHNGMTPTRTQISEATGLANIEVSALVGAMIAVGILGETEGAPYNYYVTNREDLW